MKIVVINLDQAVERMAFQRRQLTRLGLQFSRLSANSPSHKTNFEQYRDSWERPLSFSEVSLFFNHKKLWEQIVADQNPMLILEDDAYLSDNTPELLSSLNDLHDIDYLNLEARGNNQRKLLAKTAAYELGDTFLYSLYQGRSGTGGYVLWPSGAKKLIERVASGKIGIVDKFINSTYSLCAYQAEPAPLIQLDKCEHYKLSVPLVTHSSIKSSENKNLNFASYLKYKISRLKGQLSIAENYLKYCSHSTKRVVAISNRFTFK